MKIIVKLFATLREIVGQKEVEVDLPGEPSLTELLETLSKDYGADFKKYIFDSKTKRIRPYLLIMVDGKYISLSEEHDTCLRDGSIVAILPPVGGG